MTEFLHNFHFIRPFWLIALPIIILFYFKYFKGMKNKSSWEGVFDKHLLDFLLIKNSGNNRKKIGYAVLTGMISSIIILSSPTWSKTEAANVEPENPVMILLSLSSDMLNNDVSPNRLSRAKFKISDLISELQTAQIGLIVYNDEPYLVSPITNDINLIENTITNIDETIMPSNGDRLDRALSFAIKRFKEAKYHQGNIIIITSDVGERLDLASNSIKSIANSSYKISILNINNKKNEKLSILSNYKNVTSVNLSVDDTDIKLIAKSINQNISDIKKIAENNSIIWQEYAYFFLLIPLLSCLYLFRRGILAIALFFSFAQPANAAFFKNNDQEAIELYNQEEYEKAVEKFQDNKWLGASHYKNQNFEKAVEYFSKSDDETSKYNQANALAKSGKTEEAIKKYEEILDKNPKHEDAKFNLEYLKQQNQDEKESSDNQKQNDEDNKNQDQKDEEKDIDASSSKDSKDEKTEENKEDSKPENAQKPDMNEEKEEEQEVETKSEDSKPQEYKYRNIPDNPGGLLRAFIYKEYKKGRFNND